MKKETWKTLIQILVSILTAIGTTLGVTSCMGYGPIADGCEVPDKKKKGESLLCKKKGRHPVGMPLFSVAKCRNRLAPAFLCRDNYRSWCKHSCQL